MKHKTWFRLVIKAVGVLLIGLSLRQISMLCVWLILWLLEGIPALSPGASAPRLPVDFAYMLPDVAVFAFGVYLFFGGKWIVNNAIPSNRFYCPECGYDLSQSKSERCPECGVALPIRETQNQP